MSGVSLAGVLRAFSGRHWDVLALRAVLAPFFINSNVILECPQMVLVRFRHLFFLLFMFEFPYA